MPNDRNDPFGQGREHYKTDPVFLIGNGKSRKDFDLERLRSIGTIIGCNALYRDFDPDILVAIDSKMINELNAAKTVIKEMNMMIITPHNRSAHLHESYLYKTGKFNTSGCFAMKLIAEKMQPKRCYMLGMDGFAGNVYDGTKNYAVHTLQNFKGVHNFYLDALRASKDTIFINVNDDYE